MQNRYVDRQFLLAMLAIPLFLCLTFIIDTPRMLVGLAVGIIIIGIVGWYYSGYLPLTWVIRLVSTLMIILGGAFLIWYFYVGRTLLHPVVDMKKIFESINESLVTPSP